MPSMYCSMLITVIPKTFRVWACEWGVVGVACRGDAGRKSKASGKWTPWLATQYRKLPDFYRRLECSWDPPFLPWDDRVRKLFMNQEEDILPDAVSASTLIVTLPASRNGIQKCALFINHSVYGTFYSSPNKLQHWFEGCLNKSSVMPQWIPYFAP